MLKHLGDSPDTPGMIAAVPPPLTDQLARHAVHAAVAQHFGSTRELFGLSCLRVKADRIRCEWSYGINGGPSDAYGVGTVETLPARAGGVARYGYTFRVDVAHRISRQPLRYRSRLTRWRYTSPSHAALTARLARDFTTTADDAFAAWENRSGATGSPDPAGAQCSWALNDDGRISSACTATYTARTGGTTAHDCQVTAAGDWARGRWVGIGLDADDCDTPG